jgi:hypothetical protein
MANWVKGQAAAVEFGHFDEFDAEFGEDLAARDFIG